MALLKFGAFVTEGSGSLGGHTIQHSKGGMQLRNKPIPRSGPSAAQYAIRSINPQLQAGWKALTDAQRKIWNNFAPHPLSGHSLWMKYQFQRKIELLPFLSHPSLHLATYLGPELIANGTFESSAGWYINPESSVHDGRLFMATTPPTRNYCTTACSWNIPHTVYRVLIDTSDTIGVMTWGCGTAPWQSLLNGSKVYFISWSSVINTFFFNIASGASANVDNLSVKKVFNY